MKRRPHIAISIETSTIYGRGILAGIASYLRTHGPWAIFIDQYIRNVPLLPEQLMTWKGDGIIGRFTTPEIARIIRKRGIPYVDLNDHYGFLGLPRVGSDMDAIGRMAAGHLMEYGFQNIAFCGFSEMAWSTGRRRGVEEAARGRANFCGAYESDIRNERITRWELERARFQAWVRQLPLPVGIVACNDMKGYQVLDALRGIDVVVPEEISVVSVDDDPAFNQMSYPPLSSVRLNPQRIGVEAASLLARLMSGEKLPVRETLIPPLQVVTRQSTDVVAVSDPFVARAVQLIRDHAFDGWSVKDVLRQLSISRAALDSRFRKALGRSPHEQIRLVRLNRVKQLLAETSWTIEQIATATGYQHPEYLSVQFTRIEGESPSSWRLKHQVSDQGSSFPPE